MQVVEASQDFIPIILLTADRPPELHDAGANQSINQVLVIAHILKYNFLGHFLFCIVWYITLE
jgi:isochorismate synthase/2-succinyl-5-enolpyruvyl-6-hydroxy-3-cyclohexene-1-carboxylate synthase/2-succinyl-6-hydroxy-2,4-cyclohexadiene-1-carboxylate synthase/O-succinylbenzoate synthase